MLLCCKVNSKHVLSVHEYGDLSEGFKKIGNVFNRPSSSDTFDTSRFVGDLGNVMSDENGRATFRMVDHLVKTWDVIGRTICVGESEDLRPQGFNKAM